MNGYDQAIEKNEPSFTSDSFFAMRIDTQPLMRRVEMFLNSTRSVLKMNERGDVIEEQIKFGDPLCNQEGVNGLMKLLELSINPQMVQGNMNRRMYNDFLFYTRIEITQAIINNCVDWEIKDSKLKMIVDSIMRAIEVFTTRLIDNKERDSYGKLNVQTRETVMQQGNALEQFSKDMK